MANQQVGNVRGLPVVGYGDQKLAEISADGANTVTIDSTRRIRVGDNIDIINKTTGAVLASARQVTGLTSAGVLTYSGGDVAATPGTHAVYVGGTGAPVGPVGESGGVTESQGFDLQLGNILQLRSWLNSYNATTYSAAELDKMTENDMVYAVRALSSAGSIR
jgi:hypothetical protein